MGTVSTRQSRLQTSLSMKFLVVLALIAMALAEPEADPALVYTTNTLPLTASALHTPLVYNTQALQKPLVYTAAGVHHPVVYKSAVQTPVVYKSAVHTPVVYNTPLTTPLLSKVFPSLKTAPVVSHIAKRKAEADPALLYTAGLHTPLVYNTAVHHPFVYNNLLLKTPDNAVVPTAGGYIHSSHVGVCTNNVGVRVPC